MTDIRSQGEHYPNDPDAEKAVLGGLLVDPDMLPRVAGILEGPEDFHDPFRASVYGAMLALQADGQAIDVVTVMDRLNGTGDIGALMDLTAASPTSVHAETHARVVAEKAERKRLAQASEVTAKLAFDEGTSLDDAHDASMEALLAARGKQRRRAKPMSELVKDYYDRIEVLAKSGVPPGIPTGYEDLDKILRGLHDTDLVILAARPSVGKTALALNVTRNVALLGKRVGFFSLEMSNEQLAQRLASIDSSVPLENLKAGKLTDAEWAAFMRSVDAMSRLPVYVDDTPGLSPQGLRAKALLLDAEVGGLDLLVVDYLQLMRTQGKRYEQVTEISGALKALAKDMRIPVLALSQLNRGLESRLDKRPKLSDLRESGALEQDADVVIFIYRDELYDENTERPHIADVIVAKHRNGRTGAAALYYKDELTKFLDAEVRRRDLNGDVGSTWI